MARLVEYVIVAGIKKPMVDSTQSPEMLRRFPPEDHKDFPLPPDVVFFCQPEGCTTASKRISLRQINSFVFTLTDKETGITRYGICCNFYRPCLGMPQKRHSKIVRSVSTSSNNAPEDVLTEIINKEEKNSHILLERTKSTPVVNGEHPIKSRHIHSNSMLCYSLTSICIVSSYPFISTFRECLFVLRKLIESRSWNKEKEPFWKRENITYFDGNQNIGRLPLIECRNWTVFFNNNDLNAHLIKSDLIEIENWIDSLLRIPLPVAGLNRVEVELLPRHIQPPITFALPEKSRFSYLDYPVHLPLELLGVETCLKVLTCIMLEQKVVLQSCDYNALSISVMALASMLYPLQYMFPIIPLLPTCMRNAEQLLLAPTPYIIGIPSSFFRIKGMSFQVPHDIMIVDLDTNKMTIPYTMEEIPPFPEPEGSALKAQLTQCLACLALSPQPINDLDKVPELPRPHSDSIQGNRSHIIYGNDMDSIDIAVRSALVKFFCSENVLSGFAEYTRIIRLYPRPVVAFQKESFLKSRPEESSFLRELCATQAVEFFAEWIVNPDNVVYKKVLGNILDPRIIGDKPRWYSHYVQPFYYQVHNPHSRLGFDLYEDSETDDDDDDQFPSTIDEEEKEYSDCCDENCSCCSSFDDSEDSHVSAHVSGEQQPTDEDFVNNKIYSLYDRSYSSILTEEETAELHEAILADSVYKSPAYRAEIDLENNASVDQSSIVGTSLEGGTSERDVDSLSEIAEVTTSSSSEGSLPPQPTGYFSVKKPNTARRWSHLIGSIHPKLQSRLSTDSVSSNVSVTSLLSMQTEKLAKPTPLLNAKWNSDRTLEVRSLASSNEPSLYKTSMSYDGNIYNSENQQLITEIVGYVKSGDGVGWLSTKRLRRIVMYEGLRQYLMNQLDIVHKSNHNVLHDVHISRNVYRGYLELMKLVVEGYEHSIKANGMGGMNSLVLFFELAHRYYCGKKYEDDSTRVVSPAIVKSASVDDIKESTVKIESNFDKDSDSSLHYHRELGDVLAKQNGGKHLTAVSQSSSVSGIDGNEASEPPTLSHSTLAVSKSTDASASTKKKSNGNEENDTNEKMYLVTKSNCSFGYRFFHGKAIKSVLEPPGRGVSGTGRRYLFEGLQRHRSPIYDNMDFWDSFFLDSVAAEREAAGMDINPIELINRYKSLGNREKQLLEEDEDSLLIVLLHNLVAFMLCLNINKKQIKFKVRRLLARAHVGLSQTQWIDKVLDVIEDLNGNDIDLLVPRSRRLKVQIFVVHLGDSQTGIVFFLEVREDCIVLKSTNGSIVERWWYENIVNLSCSPKTKMLCIWIRCGEETDLQKISTKKCKSLYNSIKESMKKAAERLDKTGVGMNLGGSFTVVDSFTGQQGILKVSLDGVTILFVDKKLTIDVRYLKNCCAKRKILIVEEFLPHDQTVTEHQFHTEEANEICYAILCLFSYIAAARNTVTTHSTTSSSDQGTVS